jgi:hypothetical protein
MPLVSDGKGKAVAHGELRAIGFWMVAVAGSPTARHRGFFCWDEEMPGRRFRPDLVYSKQVLEAAKAFARAERAQ